MTKNRVLLLGWLIYTTVVCALPASPGDLGRGGPNGATLPIEVGEERSVRPEALPDPTPASLPGSIEGAPVSTDEVNRGRRSVLEEVAGLDRPVSFTETKIPLGELLKKLADETGVPLVAAPEVTDEPVAVVVREMPARELLLQVAELLDYQWSRYGREERTRYVIWQDLASKQREEALQQQDFAGVENCFRQELQRYGEMAALSQGQLQRILEAEERHRQELARLSPQQCEALDSTPEEREHSRRFRAAQGLFSPVPRALVALLKRLSAQQWAMLREAGQLAFSTEPQSPASGNPSLPLPEEVDRLLRVSQPCVYRAVAPGATLDPELETWLRQRDQAMQDQWVRASGYRVTIRLGASRLPMEGSFSLTVEAKPIRGAADSNAVLGTVGGGTSLSLNVDREDVEQPAMTDTPQRHPELENDPVFNTRKSFRIETKRQTAPPELGSSSGLRVQNLLPDLARTYGVQFIADAYWASPPIAESEVYTGQPQALSALLDRLTANGHRWDRVPTTSVGSREAGGSSLVLLRSRNWFFDRPKEAPLRLVRQWRKLCDRYGALPLETYLEMATSLNDGQLASLGDLVNEGVLPYELEDLRTVHSARDALRLYASLSSAQRQALWQGKVVSAARMTSVQRDLILAAVQEASHAEAMPAELLSPAADGLSVTTERRVQIKEQREGSIRYYTEPAAAPAALEPAGTPTASTGAPLTTNVLLSRLTAPAAERVVVTRHPITRVRLEFRYGAVAYEMADLTIASPR